MELFAIDHRKLGYDKQQAANVNLFSIFTLNNCSPTKMTLSLWLICLRSQIVTSNKIDAYGQDQT